MFRGLARIATLLLLPGFAAAQDPMNTGDILADARVIIASERDDIRIWAHAPRVTVFGDAAVEAHVRDIIGKIDDAVQSPFGDSLFGSVTFRQLPVDFGEGQQRLRLRMTEGGPSGYQIVANLGGPQATFETDILIVVAGRPEIAVINGLWGLERSASRAMLEGGFHRCYYSLRSRDGVRLGSLVSIYPLARPDILEECLWEELFHALGPLQDADGTEFFSFDDRAIAYSSLSEEEKTNLELRQRRNDLLLLRALYESGTPPGGSPDDVIAYLAGLIDG